MQLKIFGTQFEPYALNVLPRTNTAQQYKQKDNDSGTRSDSERDKFIFGLALICLPLRYL